MSPGSGGPAVEKPDPAALPHPGAQAQVIASALQSLRERDGLNQAEAFDALVRLSRRHQRSILAVSRDLVADTDPDIDPGAGT